MAPRTRSQRREVENPRYQSEGLKSAGHQKAPSDRLSTVAESPQTPSRKAPVPIAAIVPESPGNQEGNSALSGTTVHHVSDAEDEADPLEMVDELPDLQQAASSLLDLLISSSSDPTSIFNAAKRIRDTDSKRVKRHSKKLLERMKVYGEQTFINVLSLKSQIPSVLAKDGIHSWDPSPALHLTNCARLALDILLEAPGLPEGSTMQAIRSLDKYFPAPFMDEVTDGTRSALIGASATEKATFELALEIRTQYFILELEGHQTEPDFDPESVLKEVFYNSRGLDPEDSGLLLGFNLAGTFEDRNGSLPDRFRDAVKERIGDLSIHIDDEDGLNIKGLKAAFSWKRFVHRTAKFIHQREREIRHDLQTQASFDEVKTLIRQEIKKRDDPNCIEPADSRESTAPLSAPRSSQPPLTPSIRGEQGTAALPHSNATSRGLATPLESLGRDIRAMPPPETPVVNLSPEPATVSCAPHGRKSTGHYKNKPDKTFLNVKGVRSVMDLEKQTHQQDLSHLESQHQEQDPGALGSYVATSPSDARGHSGTPDEIPQTQDTTTVISPDRDGPSHRTGRIRETPPSAPQEDQEVLPEAPKTTQDASRHTSANQQRNAQSTPAGHRTLYDPQSGARRISPIGDSQTPGSEKESRPTEIAPSRKRTHDEIEGSEESDTEHETAATDEESIARRRQQKPNQKRPRPLDRLDRLESDSPSDGPQNQLQSSLNETTEPARQPSRPPSETPPARISEWDRLHAPRVLQRATVNSGRGWWTKERSDRLVELIGSRGTKWKEIVDDDATYPASKGGSMFISRRADGTKFQVAMKDHARVLKKRYIKNGEPLPTNFHLVSGA